MTPEEGRRELKYRQSKYLLRTVEQLLKPEEVELIWKELLLFYDPPTASVETICGSLSGDGVITASKYCGENDAVAADRNCVHAVNKCSSADKNDAGTADKNRGNDTKGR